MVVKGKRIESRSTMLAARVMGRVMPKMRTPPMVGVPALAAWEAGPSELISLPRPRWRRKSTIACPATTDNTSATTPKARARTMLRRQFLDYRLQSHRAGGLNQQVVALGQRPAERGRRLLLGR